MLLVYIDSTLKSQRGQIRLLGKSLITQELTTNMILSYVCNFFVDFMMVVVRLGGCTLGLIVARSLIENISSGIAVIEAGSFYEMDSANYSQISVYDVYYSSSSLPIM